MKKITQKKVDRRVMKALRKKAKGKRLIKKSRVFLVIPKADEPYVSRYFKEEVENEKKLFFSS
jgi:hypothetical protein